MQPLPTSEFESVLPLYRQAQVCFPLILAVLRGHQRGQVFVDKRSHPKAAVVANAFGFMMYLGDTQIVETTRWLTAALAVGGVFNSTYLLWYSPPPAWAMSLEQASGSVRRRERVRLAFDSASRVPAPTTDLPADCELAELTTDLLPATEHLHLNIASRFWNSANDFAEHGVGVCVMSGGSAISVCYSACVADNLAEIDVATHEDYRQRGLASFVVHEFIQRCQAKRIVPTWDCFTSNSASLSVAKRAGFTSSAVYNFYSFNVPLALPTAPLSGACGVKSHCTDAAPENLKCAKTE